MFGPRNRTVRRFIYLIPQRVTWQRKDPWILLGPPDPGLCYVHCAEHGEGTASTEELRRQAAIARRLKRRPLRYPVTCERTQANAMPPRLK